MKTEQLCRACSLTGQTHSLWVRVWPVRLPSVVKMESEVYVCTQHVSTFNTHISVSGVDSRSLWGAYPGVLSDTPSECVTQCAIVPSLKQNTRHRANHALSRTCAWNQTWYHLHLRATLFHNSTIEQCEVCLHWRLLVVLVGCVS